MEKRTVLLLHCSRSEATHIRKMAKHERRTISGYVLNIVIRAVRTEKSLDHLKSSGFGLQIRPQDLDCFGELQARTKRRPGPRTTKLLSCSIDDARQIRAAAKKKLMTISGMVLAALRHSWDLESGGGDS
jgi:hypothetical protein